MNRIIGRNTMVAVLLAAGMMLSAVYSDSSEVSAAIDGKCASGKLSAKLTGWQLNGKTPSGMATYDEATQKLEVSVESVSLPDGKKLAIAIEEERIGELEPLKDGAARGTVTRSLKEGAAVRVYDGDRPIVSRPLACEATTPNTQ